MTKIVVSLIVPFTFCDEGEYHIRLSGRTYKVKIIHVKNTEGIEKTRASICMSPELVPDDPQGLYYISQVTITIPLFSSESSNEWLMNQGLVSYACMKYLNRLTEVVRFTTHRYWIKMITLRDIDIFYYKTRYYIWMKVQCKQNSSFPWNVISFSFFRCSD
jgi:hypothetical protein